MSGTVDYKSMSTSRAIWKRLLVWTVICSISAAPSFVVAAGLYPSPWQLGAMLAGVALFIIAYTVATGTGFVRRLHEDRRWRRTLRIGYGTRILLSVVFPVGLWVDLMTGVASSGVINLLLNDLEHPAAVFLTTIVQGSLLNVLLGVYCLVVYGIVRCFSRTPAEGDCPFCGYDLRASADRCPECGASIVVPDETLREAA